MRRVALHVLKKRQEGAIRTRIPKKPFGHREFSIDHALLILGGIFLVFVIVGGVSLFGIKSEEFDRSQAATLAIEREQAKKKEKPSTTEPFSIETFERTPDDIAAALDLIVMRTYLRMDEGRDIFFTTEKDGRTIRMKTRDALGAIAPSVPDTLVRALSDTAFSYRIEQGRRLHGVFIFPVESFSYAVAGMRTFERTLGKDLLPFLVPERSAPAITVIGEHPFYDYRLVDGDVRILYDQGDEPALLYGFKGTSTLIIASDEDSYRRAFSRFSTSTPLD